MFFRLVGRKVLFLHSYRDGAGRVCQRRLGQWDGAEELAVCLRDWKGWQREVERQYPDLKVKCWDRLRQQAEGFQSRLEPRRSSRSRPSGDLVRAVREEEDPEVLQSALQEIVARLARRVNPAQVQESLSRGDLARAERLCQRLLVQTRCDMPPRRRRFEAHELEAAPYLAALDTAGEVARRQDDSEGALTRARERAQLCPSRSSLYACGAAWHRLGRWEEAIDQYQRVSRKHSWRYYSAGLAHFQAGRKEQAVDEWLCGFLRERPVVDVLQRQQKGLTPWDRWPGQDYWEAHGDLWTSEAREFCLAVFAKVRTNVHCARQRGSPVRRLYTPHYRKRLLTSLGLVPEAATAPAEGESSL